MTMEPYFAEGGVSVYHGDCRAVLAQLLAESIDAVITDPPYHLTTGKKGGTGPASLNVDSPAGRSRVTTGFMGKAWDGGDIAQTPELWREVLRVAKPGAYLLAFGGTRTFHRMAVAIEDAGWEIRDTIMWVYGSGFPKSLDVGKALDKRGGVSVGWFGPWLKKWRAENKVSQRAIASLFPSETGRITGCVANWELGLNLPTPEQFNLICKTFSLPFTSIEEAEREIVGQSKRPAGWFTSGDGHAITAPATDAVKRWEGWGTALKPAYEPIIVARKPLIGTVAENVLAHGTGALNIDACRIPSGTDYTELQVTQGGKTRFTQDGANHDRGTAFEPAEPSSGKGEGGVS